VDVSILGASVALLTTSLAISHPGTPALPTRSDIWPIDRVAIGLWSPAADSASTYLQDGLILAGPLALLAGSRGDWGLGAKLAFIELEALLASASLVQFVKNITYRPRPEVFLGITGGVSPHQSFYSGHTTAAFAVVTSTYVLYTETFPEDRAVRWAFLGGAGVAATVGVLRVVAGKHYPTDVLVGAATGTLIGWGVPALHRRSSPLTLSAGPGGLAVQGRF
jgi:membrane-associated phospholipid phosphatase